MTHDDLEWLLADYNRLSEWFEEDHYYNFDVSEAEVQNRARAARIIQSGHAMIEGMAMKPVAKPVAHKLLEDE